MPTRKDKTNVAPIHREQVFIPASGATLLKQQARPKVAGRPVSSGAIEIVSPEFDLLTGVRGLLNMSKPNKVYANIGNGSNTTMFDGATTTSEAVKQGIKEARDYVRHPVIVETVERNKELAERISGKPARNMGWFTDGNRVPANTRAEVLQHYIDRPVHIQTSNDLPKGFLGDYTSANTRIRVKSGLSPYDTKRVTFHEGLHHSGYGNFEGGLYDLKAEKLFGIDDYLLGHEAAVNTAELGRMMGLELGQKYPGFQTFKDMIAKYNVDGFDKKFIFDKAILNTPRDYKRFWDALTGKYFTTAGIAATGLNLTNTDKMKCGGRRKAQLGLDIREGGIAIPIAPNMYYMDGRSHDEGGIGIGPNNKNGLEVEGGEVVKVGKNDVKVFSSVPLLRGVSPAQLVMGGANPDTVFKAQEEFKDRNRINDDGTRYQNGGKKKYNSAIRTEDDKNVSIRNRAIYSAVDSTSDYPKWWQAIGLGIGSNIKAITNPDDMNYNVTDSVADAAWRKRLGLSYDNKFLIPNKDGSVRLPKNVEMEIPTDTTMLKRRIAANEQFANQNNIMGEDWKIVQAMIDKDKEALEALRTTYKTGKPVVINEYAHNSRNLSKNGELIKDAINYKSPLNVMKNYTIQYDPKNKSINYWDTYDFNEFEWGVPGKPFEIKGNIPLKKVGGIYIKPSKRGTFTAAATKRDMGVQEFASKVLANKEDYSPAMVKKANFARNASRWKKELGGDDTKTAALKRIRNKFTISGDYNGGMFGGAGAGSVIMEQPEFVTDTITKRYLVPVTQNFNDAFRNARNSGQNEFMFNGKLYNTNLGDNPKNNSAGANRTSTIIIPIEHKEVRRRKKEYGGSMIYTINGNVKNGLSLRSKAKYGTIDKKDKDTKVGQDGLIYKIAADGEWYTDGTKHVAFKEIENSTRTARRDIFKASDVDKLDALVDENDKFISASSSIPTVGKKINLKLSKPKRTYVGGYDEEEKETKKIGSLTYEKNESGKWVPSAKQSTTTTRDGGRPKDFGMTRTGVNHPNGSYKYHPLTGEKISEIGVVETSEPSIKGTTKVTSKPSSTARGSVTKTSTSKSVSQSTPAIQDTVNKITMDAWKSSKTPKIDLSKVKMPSYNVSDLGSKETKAVKAKLNSPSTGSVKEAPWVPQYNLINTRDWLGVGTNLAGHIASYFANNALLKKAPMPIKPVQFQAAKLKTSHNINPDLANINEVAQMNLAEVGRNTASSNTSIARKQRIMNEARDARNKLYGQKENIETQLINLDRRNRQDVYNRNIAAYNDWLDKTYIAKSNKLLEKQRNLNNLISGIPMAVNTMLGTIENRKSTNDMIRAIAASNPNGDGRLLGIGDYYTQKLPDGRTAIYNKNHKLVKYV